MKAFLAVVTAALFVTSVALAPAALAQAQQPKAPAGAQAPAPKAGEKQEVQGKVKSVDPAKKTITLEDGTMLMVQDAAQLKDVKPGATIKASYEEKGGQKVATSVQVAP